MAFKELRRKINWRLFFNTYLILAAITICCFLIGMGCDENPNPSIYCRIVLTLLTFSYYAAASALFTALEFIKIDLSIFVLFVSWAIHAFIYTITITFFKKALRNRKLIK